MYFDYHVFVCMNQRLAPKQACANQSNSKELFDYFKEKIKFLKDNSAISIRLTYTGCLGRCEEGPLLVIYPEGKWYYFDTKQDIDSIINDHIVQKKTVPDLILKD